MATELWIPLFPLNTVLFPLGILPLRVFETRYTDMIRVCMKREVPFGVVLIRSGSEVGSAAVPESTGCLAHITDWDMPELGVLLLNTAGSARFHIEATRELPDHRLEARVVVLADDAPTAITPLHAVCAVALQRVIDELTAAGIAEQGDLYVSPFPQPARLDDAGWVANRWCEILPLPLIDKQRLLETTDPARRLQLVHQGLTQFGIV
jgi:Lon protease-like protein